MADDFNPTEWITTAEAANLTGYSVQYIRRLIKKGCIHGKKWARDWLVDRASLLIYQQAMTRLGGAKHDPWRTGARKKVTTED
ncbi:MAG: helix-turn-helix domain-containing protein [Anaerolineae bacterium]|nr:helix-turn-helix domain-containing protein [Anaerolineae bacterium]